MKGRILGYDSRTGEGLISSDDGARYPFTTEDWRQRSQPQTGQIVDFEPHMEQAKAIYTLVDPGRRSGGSGTMVAEKSRIAAALLAFFLGGLGIHKFYLGKTTAGVIMLCVSLFGAILFLIPTLVIGLIAFIEFIIYIATSDEEFQRKYVEGDASWL